MRAMVSPALPALTVLTASIERLGQSCARAAGAKIKRTAHATAPHHVRNDIETSLECGRSSIDFVARVGLRMMPPIGARAQPAAPPCARASHAEEPHFLTKGESDDRALRRELRPDKIFGKDGRRKAHGVARGARVVILCPRGEDEIREREGEYRHAEEESIGDPLHVVFELPPILRGSHPFAHDVLAQPVFLHVAASLLALAARLTG